jgi:nicotinamidase-related amidase
MRPVTTLPNRPDTALIIIDVQNGVVARSPDRDAVVDQIASLVDKARAKKVPVIWVQHISGDLPKGSEPGRIVPELVPDPAEPLIEKYYGDAFEETDLETTLARLGVGCLIVTGAQTDACVRSTLHGGFTRGYDMTLVSDAHTTEDLSAYGAPPPAQVIAHTNLYWKFQTAPGRKADTVKAANVDFATA